MQKTCFKCKQVKPVSEFYAHKAMVDGLLGKCKDCTKADSRARYINKHELVMAYERRRNASASRKQKKGQYQRKARMSHPDKDRARRMVNYHLSRGTITRQPCEVCGNQKSEAHHDDYSQPLSIRWLCHVHHRMVHGTILPVSIEQIGTTKDL